MELILTKTAIYASARKKLAKIYVEKCFFDKKILKNLHKSDTFHTSIANDSCGTFRQNHL